MRQQMSYDFKPCALRRIWSFYRNVARRYRHVYDLVDMERDIRKAVLNAYLIERSLLRRRPILARWQQRGWHMANAGHWYYAYTIDGDTITIQDACHEQNMHE